jgi:hypothetical protein
LAAAAAAAALAAAAAAAAAAGSDSVKMGIDYWMTRSTLGRISRGTWENNVAIATQSMASIIQAFGF